MNTSYTIGVDIGGTNSDAVLVDVSGKIIAAAKTATTADITTGFSNALRAVLEKGKVALSEIHALFLGTTHATNAILQKKELYQVGLIRLAGHHPESLPPCFSWPKDLRDALFIGLETIGGGYECQGTPITPVCLEEAKRAIVSLLEKGAESIAIVGTFSPQNGEQESSVGELVLKLAGKDFPLSLSHQIGGVGFIERENSTLLNASLKKVMSQGFGKLKEVCETLDLHCPLFVTQNNGTVIDLETALQYPVLTISAGPTNSFIGASRLAELNDAIVVDIGGTSTDIGLIKNGFPRRSLNTSHVGGVSLNFPMPDVLSIALGGGSIVTFEKDALKIGPQSVGKDIVTKAICFGGDTFTLTDAAAAFGQPLEGVKNKGAFCCPEEAKRVLITAFEKMHEEILILEGEQGSLPILLVGGGATLFPQELLEARYQIPRHANVANAYGAALAAISGVVDKVVSLKEKEKTLKALQSDAIQEAIRKGADPKSTEVVDVQIIPYHYVPNQLARVVVTAAGKQKCYTQTT